MGYLQCTRQPPPPLSARVGYLIEIEVKIDKVLDFLGHNSYSLPLGLDHFHSTAAQIKKFCWKRESFIFDA